MIVSVAGTMIPASLNWQEYGRPGKLSALPTLYHTLTVGFVISQIIVIHYCHSVIYNSIDNKMQKELHRIQTAAVYSRMFSTTGSAKLTETIHAESLI